MLLTTSALLTAIRGFTLVSTADSEMLKVA
jgi:hypothetical protein